MQNTCDVVRNQVVGLPEFFPGPGASGFGSVEHYGALRAYFEAVAAFGGCQCGGACRRNGLLDVVHDREHFKICGSNGGSERGFEADARTCVDFLQSTEGDVAEAAAPIGVDDNQTRVDNYCCTESGLGGVHASVGIPECRDRQSDSDDRGPGGRCELSGVSSERKDTKGLGDGAVYVDLNQQVGKTAGGRGANWERNKKDREKKKKQKELRAVVKDKSADEGLAWRSRRCEDRSQDKSDERRGFFSSCSDEIRTQLRESRAKMLIAENKKKESEAKERQRKIDSVTPEVALVNELLRVTRMANQLKKQTKDQRIGGWAETIADGLTKSVAESAPSSMPSVDSVLKGDSALKSEGDCVEFDQGREMRLTEYNYRKIQLDNYFDELDGYGVEEHDRAYAKLRDEFEDVSKSDIERASEAAVNKISAAMQKAGIDQYHIQDIMQQAGFEYDA